MALKVRREVLQASTRGSGRELLVPTSTQLSTVTGVWPQPNKAIVGRNAFAHEAGIHQHGMLANPLCYEIMTPASVGLSQSMLVLGKHSGRHAVESRLKQLGVVLPGDEIEDVTRKVKELADRSKFVYDEDLLAIVEHTAEPRAKLVRYQVIAGNQILPTATVEVEVEGHRRTASAVGNGPLDAALKAADAALGFELQLLEMHTRAVTAGKDALAEVTVRVVHDGIESLGPGGEHRHDRGDAQGLPLRGGRGARSARRGLSRPWRTASGRSSTRSGTRTSCRRRRRRRRPSCTWTCTSSTRSPRPRPSRSCARAACGCGAPSGRWRRWTTRSPRASGPDGLRAPAEGAAAEQVSAARAELPRVRGHALPGGRRSAGHRPRDRARAGPHPPGLDHRLRRQPHQHARGLRRAGLRHRHERGRPRARDAVPAAAQAEGLRGRV